MSRRLLSAILYAAALVGALVVTGRITAKPPDLPMVEKDVLAQPAPAPANWWEPQSSNAVQAVSVEQVADAPLFMLMRPAGRRMMTKCLLFGAHPLLALAPTDDYVNDLDDEDAPAVVESAGNLLFGTGVNSDAGLIGSVILNEGNFDIRCPAVSLEDLANRQVTSGPFHGFCVVFPAQPNFGVSFGVVVSFDVGGVKPPAPEHITVMPKEDADSAPSVCPWMREQAARKERVCFPINMDMTDDVLGNLEKLSQAQKLLETARDLGRAGYVGDALDCLEIVEHLCPGSRFEEKAAEATAEIFARCYCGDADEKATAEEQAEPAKSQDKEDDCCSDLCPLHVAGGKQAQVAHLMKLFNVFYKEGKYETAAVYAHKAHEIDPENAVCEAAVLIAKAQCKCGDKCGDGCCGCCTCKKGQAKCDGPAGCCGTACKLAKEGEIQRTLVKPITLNYSETPLRQVIDDIRTRSGLNICIDQDALDAAGISLEHPVNLKLDQVALKSALNLMLKAPHLTYVIKDEMLQITTESVARGMRHRMTYQVADILGAANYPVNYPTTEDKLIDLVVSTIEPKSWEMCGGKGTIDFFPTARSIVVNQTADIQEQIYDLLASLRRLQEQEKEKVEKAKEAAEEQEQHETCPAECPKCEKMHAAVEAKQKAEGLMRACRAAMYAGRQQEAAALARQAYQVDPKVVTSDPLFYKMQLLGGPKPHGVLPAPKPTGAVMTHPLNRLHSPMTAIPDGGTVVVGGLKASVPAMRRPELPAVDPGVVLYLDHVAADQETTPALHVVIDEEEEPAVVLTSVAKPFRRMGFTAVGMAKEVAATVSDVSSFEDCCRSLMGQYGEFGYSTAGGFHYFGQFCSEGAVWHVMYGNGGLSVWSSPVGVPAKDSTSDEPQ